MSLRIIVQLLHVYEIQRAFIHFKLTPNSKVHGDNMGPIWGRQDPGGPHVGPMNFAIWDSLHAYLFNSFGEKKIMSRLVLLFCLFVTGGNRRKLKRIAPSAMGQNNLSLTVGKHMCSSFNSLRLRQNWWHIGNNIFKCIFFNENWCILIRISLKYVSKGPTNNILA